MMTKNKSKLELEDHHWNIIEISWHWYVVRYRCSSFHGTLKKVVNSLNEISEVINKHPPDDNIVYVNKSIHIEEMKNVLLTSLKNSCKVVDESRNNEENT